MNNIVDSLLTPTILLGLFVGGFVLLFFYVLKVFKNEQKDETLKAKNEKVPINVEKKKDSSISKSKKKNSENRWSNRNDKQTFSHPWLLTSFKGHTGQVLDMDFSSNGKYLATCGDEDPDPGGLTNGSSSNKENSRPPSAEASPSVKGLSRRQRKNRRRDDASPPETKKKQKPKKESPVAITKKTVSMPVLAQYVKLNISESEFANFLCSYLVTDPQMVILGYPMEVKYRDGVYIFKNGRPALPTLHQTNQTNFDVHAREFWPYGHAPVNDGQVSSSSSDSGENLEDDDSSSSSSQSDQSDQSEVCSNNSSDISVERTCVRCGRGFFTMQDEYLTQERCRHHWGKLMNPARGLHQHHHEHSLTKFYSCCNGKSTSEGCTWGKLHVWNGTINGFNGPYFDYIRTRRRKSLPTSGNYGVYAMDCEMCYTVHGLEVAKVTVVGMDGRLVYDSYVKPRTEIVDHNTRFSGITAKDLEKRGAKTLREVQNDLMGFITAETILIGHGLENDLRALKLLHRTIVDTANSFPHQWGLPHRRSLRTLTSTYLRRDIQCGLEGHNSYEDASSCMELMLWRVRKDLSRFY